MVWSMELYGDGPCLVSAGNFFKLNSNPRLGGKLLERVWTDGHFSNKNNSLAVCHSITLTCVCWGCRLHPSAVVVTRVAANNKTFNSKQ